MTPKMLLLLLGLGLGIAIYPGLRWAFGSWTSLIGLAIAVGCAAAIARRP